VRGGAKALDFYKKAFGAEELFRMPMPDGRLGHAEMKIGNSIIMLADEAPEQNALAPKGSSPVHLMIYCEDVDKLFPRAVAAGGKLLRELKDQFYGDRSGALEDPFGHQWTIATHKEDVPPEEMDRRMKAAQH
jgi:PhnB protein